MHNLKVTYLGNHIFLLQILKDAIEEVSLKKVVQAVIVAVHMFGASLLGGEDTWRLWRPVYVLVQHSKNRALRFL